jgi:putative FmdB family regulatory protein
MPIYAYRCAACGHAKDVLQKISDPVLSTCPACGAESFQKQLTAAGFQLKGSGWYVTDFRGGAGGAKAPDAAAGGADAKPGDTSTGDTKPADAPAAGTSSGTDGGAAEGSGGGSSASAAGCGGGCACH